MYPSDHRSDIPFRDCPCFYTWLFFRGEKPFPVSQFYAFGFSWSDRGLDTRKIESFYFLLFTLHANAHISQSRNRSKDNHRNRWRRGWLERRHEFHSGPMKSRQRVSPLHGRKYHTFAIARKGWSEECFLIITFHIMYKVIKALTLWGLERDSNKLIEKGFEPTWGISTKWGFYMQAFYIKKTSIK